ncbi:MAG: methionyl-tRNA formyltransferase [Bdellovibrionales bacterium]|nr:methionyl-tRNA formyltransferase [Bdellovibrionales bacterium]
MKLKTVFFGTPSFAVPSIRATFEQTQLGLVVTQPDRPRGRGHKVLPCEVKEEASKLGLRSFSPASLRKPSAELDELKASLANFGADLFIVTAYGNLLPQEFLDMPRLGCINVHASLLPRWRGAAPIQRAVEAGDTVTGVCLQKMVMALDAGDILVSQETHLGKNESSGELFARLAQLGGDVLGDYLNKQSGLPLTGLAQDPAGITLAKKITKEEALWSPEWSAQETHNRVRAFNPWPTVKAKLEGIELKLLQTELVTEDQLPPGTFSASTPPGTLAEKGGRVFMSSFVRTGEMPFYVSLNTIQAPGKAPVRASDFLRNLIGHTPLRIVKVEQ